MEIPTYPDEDERRLERKAGELRAERASMEVPTYPDEEAFLASHALDDGETRPERKRPYEPDRIRVERNDWQRAGARSLCSTCGCEYIQHAPVIGYPWLNRLCDGSLVKL